MMVIGLKSGKEFVVQDKSYFIRIETQIKQVFISESGKRRIIVREGDIEFYDETNTQEYIDTIHKSIEETKNRQVSEEERSDYV